LAATAGAEHLTASIARFLLQNPKYLEGFVDPTIRRLVMWHALEEREHRSVAFDVYSQAGGSYATRVAMYVWFLAYLAPFVSFDVMRLIVSDPKPFKVRDALKGFKAVFGAKGVLGGSVPALLEYFRPGFHPSDDDQTELENMWRRELGLNTA
ncbi:MAG: metal-dependent hydrolase, partial [Oceanococcus sp.]